MDSFFAARLVGAGVLAVMMAVWIERASSRRGLLPPGLRGGDLRSGLRRGTALAILALVLLLVVAQPLSMAGALPEVDLDGVHPSHLFVSHALLIVALVGWYLAGSLGIASARVDPIRELGLGGRDPGRELALGTLAGLAGWAAVIVVMMALGGLMLALGGEELLPQEPPETVLWIASLPVWLRVAISFSAGFVEETFFRGFLQPRLGIVGSSLLFVMAHANYQQPWMLLGVALLSIFFALLARWRRGILAAAMAHTVFDAVQLLIVIPVMVEAGQGASALTGL
jgi:membrane protease YdiL (CAAX protease family)